MRWHPRGCAVAHKSEATRLDFDADAFQKRSQARANELRTPAWNAGRREAGNPCGAGENSIESTLMRAIRRIGLAMAVLVALGLGALAWHRYGPRHTPAGQPALAELLSPDLIALKAAFNQAGDRFRILALLSPT